MSQKNQPERSTSHFPVVRFPKLPFFGHFEDEGLGLLPFTSSTGLSVYQTNKSVVVEASLPGLKNSDIEVTLDKNFLTIRGEKKEEEENKEKQYYSKATQSYSYSIELPTQADFSHEPKTTYQDGVLNITFNKTQESQPKRIHVK